MIALCAAAPHLNLSTLTASRLSGRLKRGLLGPSGLSSAGQTHWKVRVFGLDISVFKGEGQKSKKDFSLDEKKWTSFQRSIF
jgi:hypothetical protein